MSHISRFPDLALELYTMNKKSLNSLNCAILRRNSKKVSSGNFLILLNMAQLRELSDFFFIVYSSQLKSTCF